MSEMVGLLELMNRRQRQILVHSFLYYQLDTNIIQDHTFDLWCKELAQLIKEYPETFKETVYYKDFLEFDGSSGYDLPFTMPDIQSTGLKLLHYHNKLKQGKA